MYIYILKRLINANNTLHTVKICLDGRHIPKHIYVTLFLMRLNSKHVEFHMTYNGKCFEPKHMHV